MHYIGLFVLVFSFIIPLLFYKTDSLTGLFPVNTVKTEKSRLNCFFFLGGGGGGGGETEFYDFPAELGK